MWQGRGGPIGHVVTPNIPSSAIFSILPIWSCWGDNNVEAAYWVIIWLSRALCPGVATMAQITNNVVRDRAESASLYQYNSNIVNLMNVSTYIQFKASNWRKEDCNANGCKLQTHQQCSKMQPTQSLCSTYQVLKPEWENTVAWIFLSQIRIWEKLFSASLKNNV